MAKRWAWVVVVVVVVCVVVISYTCDPNGSRQLLQKHGQTPVPGRRSAAKPCGVPPPYCGSYSCGSHSAAPPMQNPEWAGGEDGDGVVKWRRWMYLPS